MPQPGVNRARSVEGGRIQAVGRIGVHRNEIQRNLFNATMCFVSHVPRTECSPKREARTPEAPCVVSGSKGSGSSPCGYEHAQRSSRFISKRREGACRRQKGKAEITTGTSGPI